MKRLVLLDWLLVPLVLVLCLIGIVFASYGCSAKQYHIATVSVVSAHSTASLVQDEADASMCGRPTAPPVKCVTPEQRREFAKYLSEAFDWIGQTAETVKSLGPGATLGSVVTANLQRITELLNKVFDGLPSEAQARVKTLTTGGGQ